MALREKDSDREETPTESKCTKGKQRKMKVKSIYLFYLMSFFKFSSVVLFGIKLEGTSASTVSFRRSGIYPVIKCSIKGQMRVELTFSKACYTQVTCRNKY